MADLTVPMYFALRDGSLRVDGSLCPMRRARGGAERVLLRGLDRRGLIAWDGPVPRINAAGRAAVAQWDAESAPHLKLAEERAKKTEATIEAYLLARGQ